MTDHTDDIGPRVDTTYDGPDIVTLCAECGPNVRVDEDGCCVSCGATAMGEGIDWINRVAAERDRLRVEVDRLKRREDHFAKALAVADGGQYRADWAGAINRVIRERDEANTRIAELRDRLRTVQKAARDFVLFPNPIIRCEACGLPVPEDDRIEWADGVVTHRSECCGVDGVPRQRALLGVRGEGE